MIKRIIKVCFDVDIAYFEEWTGKKLTEEQVMELHKLLNDDSHFQYHVRDLIRENF